VTSWQLTNGAGTPVVNERYWLSFQPGEVRTCFNCHGQNEVDQANQSIPTNSPQALRTLLQHLKAQGHL
jgi:cytochrome c553